MYFYLFYSEGLAARGQGNTSEVRQLGTEAWDACSVTGYWMNTFFRGLNGDKENWSISRLDNKQSIQSKISRSQVTYKSR